MVGELPIQLDRGADQPLPAQVAAALREQIDRGSLRPGEALPSTRTAASQWGVARGVVVTAYEQLYAEGYVESVRGSGTRVNPELHDVVPVREGQPSGRREEMPFEAPQMGSLAPGRPITDTVVGSAWRTAWRHAAARDDVRAPALGDPSLRYEIAEHLRRMRATHRSASQVVVTSGTRDGLGLVLLTLGGGRRTLRVGIEDPGLSTLRGVAARHGADIVSLETDNAGLDPAALPTQGLDAVIVTPSHQYPMGGSLTLPRRRALLEWAARTQTVLIEDDFDSELRYSGRPLPTLAALDDATAGWVVLLGTFSRTIAPALNLGYLLAPTSIGEALHETRAQLGGTVSSVVQGALSEYLSTGAFRRHISHLLRRYGARRDDLSEAIAALPGVRLRSMDGGLHAVIEFVQGSPESARAREQAIVSSSEARALGVVPLSSYWHRGGPQLGASGIVLGIGGPRNAQYRHDVGALAGMIRAECERRR